jgi:hypothetical protein
MFFLLKNFRALNWITANRRARHRHPHPRVAFDVARVFGRGCSDVWFAGFIYAVAEGKAITSPGFADVGANITR